MTKTTALAPIESAGAIASATRDARHSQAAHNYLANLAPASRRTMTQSLAAITDILLGREPGDSSEENARRVSEFRWGDLRAEHTAMIRARLVDLASPGPKGEPASLSIATANKGLVALRKTLFEAWKLGLIEKDDYERAVSFDSIKGEGQKKGRALSAKEALKLALSCEEDSTPLGARDGALVALLLFAGLRRFELAALRVSDWNAESAEIAVRYGKGQKARVVPVPEGVSIAIERWLSVRASLLSSAGMTSEHLFFGLTKAHNARTANLTTDAIFKALLQRAKRAGVKTFSPHDLRRTYIGDLLDAGADLSTAQQLAGHADPKTTANYDRRPKEIRRAAVMKLSAPFTRRT